MFRKFNIFLHKLETKIASASLIIFVLALITKFLGFLKLRLIAQTFGVTRDLDIFWASFVIPDLIFMLIIGGSVNAALIPAFIRLKKQGFKKLRQVFNLVLFLTLLLWIFLLIVLIIGLHIMAPKIAGIIVFGLKIGSHVGKLGLKTPYYFHVVQHFQNLTIIMFVGSMFLALSSVIGAFLLSFKRFAINNLSPLLYNLGIIIGVILMQVFHVTDVYILAISIVFGAFLHFLIQFIYMILVYKEVLVKLPKDVFFVLKHKVTKPLEEVKHIFLVALPRILGVGVEQISVFFNTFWALFLGAGALSIYKFALSLHYLPIHLVSNAISQAFFPSFNESKEGSRNRIKLNGEFTRLFHKAFLLIFVLTSYIASVIFILKTSLVTILLGGGKFKSQEVYLTSLTLGVLTISIILNALLPLVLRVFYVLEETKTPFIISLLGVIMNVIFGIGFANLFGYTSIINSIKQILWNLNFEPFIKILPNMPFMFVHLARGRYSVVGLALGLGFGTLPELLFAIYIIKKRVKTIFNNSFNYTLLLNFVIILLSSLLGFLLHKLFVYNNWEHNVLGFLIEFIFINIIILGSIIWYNKDIWHMKFMK